MKAFPVGTSTFPGRTQKAPLEMKKESIPAASCCLPLAPTRPGYDLAAALGLLLVAPSQLLSVGKQHLPAVVSERRRCTESTRALNRTISTGSRRRCFLVHLDDDSIAGTSFSLLLRLPGFHYSISSDAVSAAGLTGSIVDKMGWDRRPGDVVDRFLLFHLWPAAQGNNSKQLNRSAAQFSPPFRQ
ncbi:hypothetical protein BHM03_00059044 [Ensete ventricosum]|nr:hypothetical protein BHM03_00059044 [Ensete ventricosum]